ncbi:MAG: hypothetical protein IJT70_08250 [Clostridia bacterium]|nr:hypothetical protein [Clostridia bacterium]
MKLSIKKTLSILVVLCILIGSVPFASSAANTSVSTWAALASAVSSASPGDTITLTSDVTADSTIQINGNVKIAGGKTITRSASYAEQIFVVNGTLTLENITLNGNRNSTALADLAKVLISLNPGSVLNLNSGAVLTTNRADATVGAAGVQVDNATFNMYDGAQILDMHHHNGTASNIANIGPAVTVTSGTFNMYGGLISACDGRVGAVSVLGGTFNMTGGELSGNIANNNGVGGGAVYVEGTFNLNGGEISNNLSWLRGGGVYNAGTFNLLSGTISGNSVALQNSTTCDGAGVCNAGTMTMSGGLITGNTAQNSGAGVFCASGLFTLSGGEISGNTTTSYSAGGVFVDGTATFRMTGGLITSNTAAQFGGAIAVTSTASRPIEITGGLIYGNTCSSTFCGTDIYVTTDGNVASTSLGAGCVVYRLYQDNKNNRYSPSNAVLVNSSTLTKNYGYVYITTGSAHSFGDWVITTAPNCDTPGTREHTCTVCGVTEQETIGALGHDMHVITVDPTCGEDGYVRVECTRCNYVSSITPIPATGHIPGDWKITTPATAGSAGTLSRYCLDCGGFVDSTSYTVNDPIIDIEFSEPEEFDTEYNTITAVVNIVNNPGVWSDAFYLYYDPAFTVVSAENGDVFPNANAVVSATAIDVANDADASAVFTAAGDPINVRAFCYYAESAGLSNLSADGTLATVTFKYANDLEDTYLFGIVSDRESTIDSNGNNVYLIDSDKSVAIEPIINCNHVLGGWNVTTAPTCTESGLRVKACTICGKVLVRETLAATGHTPGSWVVTVQPGAGEGERVKYCTSCGIVLETEVLRPTQTMNAYMTAVTATPGSTVSMDIYLENNPGFWGARFFVYYPNNIAVTSVTNGSIFPTECTETSTLNFNPYSNPIAVQAFNKMGITEQNILTTCLYYESPDVSSDVTNNGKLATVTFSVPAGYTGDIVISLMCDEAVDHNVNDVTINTYGANILVTDCLHANTAWTVSTAPTCTEPGVRSLVCSDCGAVVDTEPIAATGHGASSWSVTKQPTCTETGVNSLICSVCGAVINTQIISATGHGATVWSISTAPTCTETGLRTGVCSICGDTVASETIPANGHTFSNEFTVDVEPTDTTAGSKSRHCLYCDAVTDVTEIPPTGTPVLLGDVNGDGVITSKDTRALKQYLVGILGDEDIVLANADVNQDGDITAKDARALKTLLVS